MSVTFTEALAWADVTAPDPDAAGLEVPVLCGGQRQGDVAVIPVDLVPDAPAFTGGAPVPQSGVAVVRGESGGNTHILFGVGDVAYQAVEDDLRLGVLDVAEGAVAYLIHTDEHGVNAVGPGRYLVTGKREQTDEVRRVMD